MVVWVKKIKSDPGKSVYSGGFPSRNGGMFPEKGGGDFVHPLVIKACEGEKSPFFFLRFLLSVSIRVGLLDAGLVLCVFTRQLHMLSIKHAKKHPHSEKTNETPHCASLYARM